MSLDLFSLFKINFGSVRKYVFRLAIGFFVIFSACAKKNNLSTESGNSAVIEKYAQKLQVPKSQITNYHLYQFIDEWIGTKYKYGGMSKAGVDCSGFVNILYNNVYKKELPRMTSDIAKIIKKVSKHKLSEGDIVLFNISGKKNSHAGVYLTNNYFVHASTSKGVMISSLDNPYYVKAYSKGGGI